MRWKTPLTEEFSADLRRNIVGLYVDGALEIFRKEMEAGLQEKKNESAKYAGKLLEQEKTKKTFPGKWMEI